MWCNVGRAAPQLFLAPVIRASALSSHVSTNINLFHADLWAAFLTSSCPWYLLWNLAINIFELFLFCCTWGKLQASCNYRASASSCFYLSFHGWNMHLVLFSMYSFPFCFPLRRLVVCIGADMIRACNYLHIHWTFGMTSRSKCLSCKSLPGGTVCFPGDKIKARVHNCIWHFAAGM